jgi:hypothetical protein
LEVVLKGEYVDREAMPTYYPGDRIKLNLEIEHKPNFRTITATLVISPEWEGASSFTRDLNARGLTTVEISADGSKISTVAFECNTAAWNLEPGAVFELREVTGETFTRQRVVFDLAEDQAPRFYYAAEPLDSTPVVKHASTERN